MLLEHVDECGLVIRATERSRVHHDGTIETAVGLDVGDTHPLEAFIIDPIELFCDDLAKQLIETRASLRALVAS